MKRAIRVVLMASIILAVLCIFVSYRYREILPYALISVLQHSAQKKIDKWILVVDQNNKPVPSYSVAITEWSPAILPLWQPNSRNVFKETNSYGLLHYESAGRVTCASIDNHIYQRVHNPSFLWGDSMQIGQNKVYYAYGYRHQEEYLGSESQPGVLRVFRSGFPIRLLYSWHKISGIKKSQYWCVDILSGKAWADDRPMGDISLKDTEDESNAEGPYASKYLQYKAGMRCELAPRLDRWGIVPPEEGYVKELYWPAEWAGYNGNDLQCYYRIARKGHNGYYYGVIWLAARWIKDGIPIECFTNLQGDRNLFHRGYYGWIDTYPRDRGSYISPPIDE